jgi:hypothetical protein
MSTPTDEERSIKAEALAWLSDMARTPVLVNTEVTA